MSFLRKEIAIQIRQNRALLVENASEAFVITVKFNVANMANLLDGSKRFARNPFPRRRRPTPVPEGDGTKVILQLSGEFSKRVKGVCSMA